MKSRICDICGYLLQMSSDGTVRLCCRRATFFGLPVPAMKKDSPKDPKDKANFVVVGSGAL